MACSESPWQDWRNGSVHSRPGGTPCSSWSQRSKRAYSSSRAPTRARHNHRGTAPPRGSACPRGCAAARLVRERRVSQWRARPIAGSWGFHHGFNDLLGDFRARAQPAQVLRPGHPRCSGVCVVRAAVHSYQDMIAIIGEHHVTSRGAPPGCGGHISQACQKRLHAEIPAKASSLNLGLGIVLPSGISCLLRLLLYPTSTFFQQSRRRSYFLPHSWVIRPG